MGTSKNYPSPNTPRWTAVRTCYTNKKIPIERVAAEVWRAATSENRELTNMLSSDILFRCNHIVENSSTAMEAYTKFNDEIMVSKQSSIATEFAKRAIVPSFNSADPGSTWRSNFISEMTDYFVSRDIAGFFGGDNRNQNIRDLSNFRNEIKTIVLGKVKSSNTEISNKSQWQDFIQSSLEQLKNK
jgi:hypothetical protein